MPRDSFCIQYTNCTGCPKNVENILVYRNLPKGEHIPKDKCTQNCMLFMIKGELLINSEEHPVITLRERQIVLQAIGSKVEILALTDVEYVVYWFNELPLLCEDRYREMMEQAEAPLTYTPLIMSERLYHLVTSMPEFLAEENPCSKYIDLKCKELVFLITNFYPLPPTEFILLSDQHLYGKFPLFRHAELQQREERGRICASGRIYDHYFPPPFQKPLWCARIRMDTGKETGRNPGRPAAHQNANH